MSGILQESITQSTDTDRGVCIWPWQLIALDKSGPYLSVAGIRCIPIKHTFGLCPVFMFVFYISGNTVIFFSVLCGYSCVYIFDFRLILNETPDKWWPVERRSRSDRNSCFVQGMCFFPSTAVAIVKELLTLRRSTAFSWVTGNTYHT